MDDKGKYLIHLNEILKKYKLDGGYIYSAYENAINTGNFHSCYIDDRVKNASKLKKELAVLLDLYFDEYPESKKPLYSYK